MPEKTSWKEPLERDPKERRPGKGPSVLKRVWGRKVSDLGFAEFVSILHQVAAKTRTEVVQIDRWLPTSKSCAACGMLQEMPLSVRHFHCPHCGWSRSRDQNAALNILAAGASAAGLGDVSRPLVAAVSA